MGKLREKEPTKIYFQNISPIIGYISKDLQITKMLALRNETILDNIIALTNNNCQQDQL